MADRPPRDITPAGFFEEWLPRRFAEEYGGARRQPAELKVRVRLDGEGGGAWDLDVKGPSLAVGPVGDAPATVQLAQSVEDWRAIAVGEAPGSGASDLAPPQASPLDVLFVDPASRQLLQTVRGTVRFEVTGYRGRTWILTATFGGATPPLCPDATITVDADTYARILARTLAPPEAFFAGRIHLAGDTALAMQLGMALLPRFG